MNLEPSTARWHLLLDPDHPEDLVVAKVRYERTGAHPNVDALMRAATEDVNAGRVMLFTQVEMEAWLSCSCGIARLTFAQPAAWLPEQVSHLFESALADLVDVVGADKAVILIPSPEWTSPPLLLSTTPEQTRVFVPEAWEDVVQAARIDEFKALEMADKPVSWVSWGVETGGLGLDDSELRAALGGEHPDRGRVKRLHRCPEPAAGSSARWRSAQAHMLMRPPATDEEGNRDWGYYDTVLFVSRPEPADHPSLTDLTSVAEAEARDKDHALIWLACPDSILRLRSVTETEDTSVEDPGFSLGFLMGLIQRLLPELACVLEATSCAVMVPAPTDGEQRFDEPLLLTFDGRGEGQVMLSPDRWYPRSSEWCEDLNITTDRLTAALAGQYPDEAGVLARYRPVFDQPD